MYFCHAPFDRSPEFTDFTNLWNSSPGKIDGDRLTASHRQVPYDKAGVMADYDALNFPGRDVIRKIFFHWGGKAD